MSSLLSTPHLQNEEAAYAYVEARVWPDGPFCPHCGSMDRIVPIKANKEAKIRYGLKRCGDCRKQFTVKVGTVFESSHVPLHIWLQAMTLLCGSKKGISTNQLSRTLGVTLKTAWFISHRIREAMKPSAGGSIGGAGITIEVDETFLGKRADTFVNGKGWVTKRGTAGMQSIVSLVERGGRARSIHVENIRKPEIVRAMEAADRRSVLNTDQAQHYRRIGVQFSAHYMVDHSRDEYVRGDAHTNTIEGFFSIFKRGMRGVYQHCGERHLHRYLSEFDFRYSHRIALGIDDVARTDQAIRGIVGKRLTYGPTRRQAPSLQAAT